MADDNLPMKEMDKRVEKLDTIDETDQVIGQLALESGAREAETELGAPGIVRVISKSSSTEECQKTVEGSGEWVVMVDTDMPNSSPTASPSMDHTIDYGVSLSSYKLPKQSPQTIFLAPRPPTYETEQSPQITYLPPHPPDYDGHGNDPTPHHPSQSPCPRHGSNSGSQLPKRRQLNNLPAQDRIAGPAEAYKSWSGR